MLPIALLTDLAQVIVTGGAYLVEELADERQVADDGAWRKSTLSPQKVFEVFEDPIVRGQWRRRGRRDRAFLVQYR